MPKTIVTDNLTTAVLKADWFDPELNPKLAAFAEHYGTVILPTRPRMPRRRKSTERIDAIVTAIMGIGRAQMNEPVGGGTYDNYGLGMWTVRLA